MTSQPPESPGRRVHWGRWALAGFITAAGFAGALLPLQAVEILHLRIYATVWEPAEQFQGVAFTVVTVAAAVGVWMTGIGIFRDAFLHQGDRSWSWWTPLAGAIPAALAVHAFERLWIAFFALLVHVVAAGATRERRWMRGGITVAAILCLPFTDGVRELYAKRVIKVFHYERMRYMDIFTFARKGGNHAGRGDYTGYLRAIEDLPIEPAELLWLGIFSITTDPWGRPYHFAESRAIEEDLAHKDFGRWELDYTFMSLGADGRPGGMGIDGDIYAENVIEPEIVVPSRIRPPSSDLLAPAKRP